MSVLPPTLLLAGGKCPPELEKLTGAKLKALIQLRGKPLFTYVLDAILGLSGEKCVLVFCGESAEGFPPAPEPSVSYLEYAGSLSEAIKAAIDQFQSQIGQDFLDSKFLICSSDIPLVTSQILGEMVRASEELDADLVWPITEKRFVEAKFAKMRRTYVRTKEGTFTGGNVFLVKPHAIVENLPLVDALFKRRKNPLAMAAIFGLPLIFNVLLGRISIPEMEKEMSSRLGVKLRALPIEYPELSADLDKPSDYVAFEKMLASK